MLLEVHPEARHPLEHGLQALVEGEDGGPLAAGGGGQGVLDRQRRLATPGRADQQHAGAELDAAAEQGVEFRVVRLEHAPLLPVVVLGGDQPREHVQPAATG